MKNKLTALLIFSIIYSLGYSQDSCLKKFEERTIFQFGYHYVINGKPLTIKQLRSELNKYNDAAAEYDLFHRKAKLSAIMSGGGVLMELIAIAVYENNHSLSKGLMIGAGVSLVTSLPISIAGRNHLQKSIWLYNKNVMAF